jgi:phosphoribosylformimino-5-aminoimidazole carboxamide ribotide isomerase
MLILPAIDLRAGRCMRPHDGDPETETVYSEDPAAVAEHWTELGAEWLHIINLDGALDEVAAGRKNLDALQTILDRVNTPVQFGGGLRTAGDIESVLDQGVSRVILGSMAVERPRQLVDLLSRFGPEQIVVALDVRSGRLVTRGWRKPTDVAILDLASQLQTMGVRHVTYTDVASDGTPSGIDAEGCARLGRSTGLKVIAAGSLAGLADVNRIKAFEQHSFEGLIIGQELYTGALSLPEVLEVARR